MKKMTYVLATIALFTGQGAFAQTVTPKPPASFPVEQYYIDQVERVETAKAICEGFYRRCLVRAAVYASPNQPSFAELEKCEKAYNKCLSGIPMLPAGFGPR